MAIEDPLQQLCVKLLRECTALAEGETCLLIKDLEPSPLSRALTAAISACGGVPMALGLPEGVYLREPLPKAVERALASADVVLIQTRRLFPQGPRRLAAEAGGRVLSLCTVTEEMALRALDVDYEELSRVTKDVADAFSQASEILIRGQAGTEIHMRIAGQSSMYIDGLARELGQSSALPAGVVAIVPIPETAEGKAILDGSIASTGLVRKPVTLKVEKGKVTDIQGGEEAERLFQILAADENGHCIAEVGLGTNPRATYTGNLVEDERVRGSGHIGLGRNTHLGGTIESSLHIDATIRKPSVYLDSKMIVNEGKFVYYG